MRATSAAPFNRRVARLGLTITLLVTPNAFPSDYAENLAALHAYIGEHYAGFKLKGIDWDFVGRSFQARVVHVETDPQFGLLCLELVAQLADGHSVLLPGRAPVPTPPLPQWGCGLACLADASGAPIIYHVEPGSGAAQLGVSPGMEVIRINGMAGRVALARTMSDWNRYYGFSSPRALRYTAARQMIMAEEEGETITLEVATVDGRTQTFELIAATQGAGGPRRPVPVAGTNEWDTVSWAKVDDDIGYIYIRRIDDRLVPGLDAAVGGLGAIRGLVIDLRGNGGGGFDRDKAFTNFVSQDEVANDKRPRFTGPIALLFDEHSMSAAEGWGSWFVATQRARTFGRPTGGMSSVKTEYTLPNGLYRVRFSTRFRKGFLDREVELLGLEPDVELYPEAADLAVGRDTVLEAAKAYLHEVLAE